MRIVGRGGAVGRWGWPTPRGEAVCGTVDARIGMPESASPMAWAGRVQAEAATGRASCRAEGRSFARSGPR